jgi:hypothetical protein
MPKPPKKPAERRMSKSYILRMSSDRRQPGVVKFLPEGEIPKGAADVPWHIEERELQPWIKRRIKRAKPGELLAQGPADKLYADKGLGARKPELPPKKPSFLLRLFRAIEE